MGWISSSETNARGNITLMSFGLRKRPPSKKAEKIIENLAAMLKKYSAYLIRMKAERLPISAVPAGKKAVPLAVLGAEVTVSIFHRITGVLHYFHDIDAFMQGYAYALLKLGGTMICSDFHPFTKIADILESGTAIHELLLNCCF